MAAGPQTQSPLLPPQARRAWRIALGLLGLSLVLGLPLAEILEYTQEAEAFSRDWYAGLGAPFGLAAVLLLSLQWLIAAKLRALDRVLPLNRLFQLHRGIGLAAVLCALAHPVIMFWPKLPRIGPFRTELWPEMLGAAVLLGLCGAVFTAVFRVQLRLPFHLWLPLHRYGMALLSLAVLVHAAFVEEHVELGTAHGALVAGLALFALSNLLAQGSLYRVSGLRPVGDSAVAVDLEPVQGGAPVHAPGQFALVTFQAKALPREEHPWTISSASSTAPALQLTIKKSGDFTAGIDRLEPGETARVRGPFGLFSYRALENPVRNDLVMIAGGVGITPFLSMLRDMADRGDERRVVLIWSNKTESDILWREELDRLGVELSGLSVHHVLTRQPDWEGLQGHLEAPVLERLLGHVEPGSPIFLCGPPGMMAAVRRELKRCGICWKQIHTEAFHL